MKRREQCRKCAGPAGGSGPSLTLQATDFTSMQVPRAFVNLVEALEISKLRELYQESRVSCPRLILR